MRIPALLGGIAIASAVVLLGFQVVRDRPGQEPAAQPREPAERLRASPLDGDAFSDLAVALAESGSDDAAKIHAIAARRDPRDLRVRAWLADHHLAAGRHAAALEQMDVILRLSPDARRALLPALLQLSADPAFADALAERLGRSPTWRSALLAAMRADPESTGATNVFAALREHDGLDEDEAGRWINALIRANQWGRAYSLWASGLDLAPGESLPMLWNGGFDVRPTGTGFDWRVGSAPGSFTEFQTVEGARGEAAHLVFHGRPVDSANLEQALHLPPGTYRLTLRMKAQALRSDQGLTWTVTCSQGKSRFMGERVGGTFDWRQSTLVFDIPVTGCAGQWLRLRNPAPAGSARMVSGELWVEDVTLESSDRPS